MNRKSIAESDSEEKLSSVNTVSASAEAEETRNIVTIVCHQVLFRIAWIFKTESVLMPAFLDTLTESGTVRGMLPLLNRFGQSFAPFLLSDRLRQAPRKTRWLGRTTASMGLPFLCMAAAVYGGTGAEQTPYLVPLFLLLYLAFFCLHGINQMTIGTLQGKLIRPQRRGRVISAAAFIGTPLAILSAWWLMGQWLTEASPFARIFGFTGTVFLLAGATTLLLRETPDTAPAASRGNQWKQAWQGLQQDPDLRRLCLTAMLFVTSQLLFPHYQAIGRELGLGVAGVSRTDLMKWVIVQHAGAALIGGAAGWVADRWGTRSALRYLLFGAANVPLLAIGLRAAGAADYYWMTFLCLGFVPVTFRLQMNYALELTEPNRHPLYLSTLTLAMSLPILLSPVLGALVEYTGFVFPFLMISGLVYIAWGRTWIMIEPREEQVGGQRV